MCQGSPVNVIIMDPKNSGKYFILEERTGYDYEILAAESKSEYIDYTFDRSGSFKIYFENPNPPPRPDAEVKYSGMLIKEDDDLIIYQGERIHRKCLDEYLGPPFTKQTKQIDWTWINSFEDFRDKACRFAHMNDIKTFWFCELGNRGCSEIGCPILSIHWNEKRQNGKM